MINYSIGDKILVRNDLRIGDSYGNCMFTLPMASLRGKIVTICAQNFYNRFYINECVIAYFWSSEMFEGKIIGNKVIRNET